MLYIVINDEEERFINLEYKDIRSNYYMISNYGNIIARATDTVIKPFISNSGYKRVGLCTKKHNKRKNYSVHVLVAALFYNKVPNKNEHVNHKDGDKFHNYYKNLEIISINANIKHAYDTRLMKSGKEHHLGKYDDSIIHKICKHLENKDEMFDIISDITGDSTISRSSDRYRQWRAYIKKLRQRQFRKDIVELYDF